MNVWNSFPVMFVTNGIFIPLGSLAPSNSVTLQQRCIFKFFGFATLPNNGHMRWQTHCSESDQQEAEHGGAIKKLLNGAGYLRGGQMACVHPCENTKQMIKPLQQVQTSHQHDEQQHQHPTPTPRTPTPRTRRTRRTTRTRRTRKTRRTRRTRKTRRTRRTTRTRRTRKTRRT